MGSHKEILYRFTFKNQLTKEFRINLTNPKMELIPSEDKNPPSWTMLKFEKCSHCPLNPAKDTFCPSAKAISPVVKVFQNCKPYEEVDISIFTSEREFKSHCSIQDGLSSLIGLLMAVSGCPYLNKLKPMAFTHLPFASPEETSYRSISMYLMAQYYLSKKGHAPDWALENLETIYELIHMVNVEFTKRLRKGLKSTTTNVDSLLILDCFTQFTKWVITENPSFKDFEELFNCYLD